MYFCRRISILKSPAARRYCAQQSSSGTAAKERIEIPNRIERSPTDILRALASTVGQDPTAAHYKYHDDPYLIPKTNITKRTYAMAMEAGRKAAQWIKEEHRNLFMHQEAQPPIEAFAPKPVYTEDSEVDEAVLKRLILQAEVLDAVQVYNILKTKVDLSVDIKQSLLELLCFYNNENPLPEDNIEERWFQQNMAARDRSRKTWKDGELAEQLFAEITKEKPGDAHAYAALVRGMAKYHQAERAYALLQEAFEKNLNVDTNTFNAVISVINFLKETADQRWDLCRDLLQQMKDRQLKPNLGTLNTVLQCTSTLGNYKLARKVALKVLAEFHALGIEPSLGTYYYILIIFCRDRGPVSHVIVDIIREVEGKSFSIRHPKDTFFFATAMDVCRNHLHDRSLAKKIDALLHVGDNYNLIGDTYKESVYYRHYLALLCQTEPLDEFIQTYDLIVPNIYIPEPGIMEEFLKTIQVNAAIEYIPKIWSDMVIFDHINRESLVLLLLRIITENRPQPNIASHKDLNEEFVKIAFDVFTKGTEVTSNKYATSKKISFTGQLIGDILTLLVRGNDFEKAAQVFVHIDKNQHCIPGTPTEDCLLEFVDCCANNKAPSVAMQCFQYVVDNNMDSLQFAKRINSGFTLNENHLTKLKSVVGSEAIQK